uniref:Uncharacterized protein n=1 Tax=Anopheles arabiensis TaxID=7173 RepID=A0A182HL97_ANOAR
MKRARRVVQAAAAVPEEIVSIDSLEHKWMLHKWSLHESKGRIVLQYELEIFELRY